MNTKGNEAIYMDTEVPERVQRRTFTADYKLKILAEADRSTGSGEIGALLRREGLYSSHLTSWRNSRQKGALAGLSKKRGKTPSKTTVEAKEIERLRRENAKLRDKLLRAETVIEVQKKVSELLGVDLNPSENDEKE
jgi:transposase-like protein